MTFHWYKTGTVAVVGGSNAIVGTSTLWSTNVADGDWFKGPDGKFYEINVTDDTHITLDRNYEGSNASGQAYTIMKVGVQRDSALRLGWQVVDIMSRLRGIFDTSGDDKNIILDKTATADDAAVYCKTGGVQKWRIGTLENDNWTIQKWNGSAWVDQFSSNSFTERLQGNRTYYVRSDGNNNNTGLTNSSGGAKLTLAGALLEVAKLDFNGAIVTIQFAGPGGTFAGALIPPLQGGGLLDIKGDTTIWQTYTLNSQVTANNVGGTPVLVHGFKITSPAGTPCLSAGYGSRLIFGQIDFGSSGFAHIWANQGGFCEADGDYMITGVPSVATWLCSAHGSISSVSRTVYFAAVLAYPVTIIYAESVSVINLSGMAFPNTGSAPTGTKIFADGNAHVKAGGGNQANLPGTVTGSVVNGAVLTA